MGLEEDLKARALALISQQMATWVVEIQRHIQDHQGNLVRTLDELQETVARYDEKINEDEIAAAMSEVVAQQPPGGGGGADYSALKASLRAIEKGASLSEVLTYLVNEVGQYIDRAAMFIVKGPSAIGWYARGVQPPDVVKSVTIPLNGETVFRVVFNSRHAERGHISQAANTSQALARLGGRPEGILAVPLILRDKLAAILYCDSKQDEIPAGGHVPHGGVAAPHPGARPTRPLLGSPRLRGPPHRRRPRPLPPWETARAPRPSCSTPPPSPA